MHLRRRFPQALNLERGLEGSAGAAGADKGGDGDGAASAQKRRKGGGEGAAFAADGGEFRFFSGDWGNLAGAMPAGEYDVILTSDSIYSISSQVPSHGWALDRCPPRAGENSLRRCC